MGLSLASLKQPIVDELGPRVSSEADLMRRPAIELSLEVALIQFRGHFRKGGYDGIDGHREETHDGVRRSFTDEFKAGAVRLVIDEGKSVGQAARELDLTESALRMWVERARADRGTGKPGALTTAEREELSGCAKRIASSRRSARS